MIKSGHKDVHWLRCDGLNDLRNLIRFADARRIETVGAGFSVGSEPVQGRMEWVEIVDEPGFAAPGQQDATARSVNRSARGPNTIDCQFLLVERCVRPTRAV